MSDLRKVAVASDSLSKEVAGVLVLYSTEVASVSVSYSGELACLSVLASR